jgi:hypothetical protein
MLPYVFSSSHLAATSTPKNFQKIIIINFLVEQIHIYMGGFDSFNVDL